MDTHVKHPNQTRKDPPGPVVLGLAFSWVLAIACLKRKGGAALKWRLTEENLWGPGLANRATSRLESCCARATGNPSLSASSRSVTCARLERPLLALVKSEHPALEGPLTKAWSLMKETQYTKLSCLTESHPSWRTRYLPRTHSLFFILIILFGFYRKYRKTNENSHIQFHWQR